MVTDLYSPKDIARAAGVPEIHVIAALGGSRSVARAEAVQVGAAVVLKLRPANATTPDGLFAIFSGHAHDLRSRSVFALSSTVHATILAVVVFIATFNLAPRAATLAHDEKPSDMMRLIFLATPGPGGGGGGGGLQQPTPPPKAMREGHHSISSPVPPAKPIVPAPTPKPPEPIKADPLPAIAAPIVNSPADSRDRVGVLEQSAADADAHGRTGGGAGTGNGTGLGQGNGPGVGAGSGGGTGGGPYRPGSGIDAPRLLQEVKADYTEEARQRGITGDVVMEIVVRRDGSIGDVKILQGLASGLNERAVQAVRQWKFAPATKQGVPVDVIVEVAVEFKLR